jgi:hypothetical protein
MKCTASVGRASRSSASSRRRKPVECRAVYVVCVDNESNPESLELRKIYRTMPDADAAKHGYVRVVDESGEGYLALPRTLPRTARKVLA